MYTDASSLTSPRRRQRRKAARPQELLDAATALFAERGYAATRLEDVAARAGVVKGTIYLYFADKLALFEAVIRHAIAPLLEADEAWLTSADALPEDPYAQLEALLRRWGERLLSTPAGAIAKLVMAEAHNFPQMARIYHDLVIERALALLVRVIERGQALGAMTTAIAAPSLARLVVAPLMHRVLWQRSFALVCPEVHDDEAQFWRDYLGFLRQGLGMGKAASDAGAGQPYRLARNVGAGGSETKRGAKKRPLRRT